MARIRTIKPEFFTSEDIVALSPLARLLYIALWCEADREGRMAWKPLTFKIRYLPVEACDITALCQELLDRGLVRLYGDGLAFIPKFSDHQHVNPRESVSNLPTPPNTKDAGPKKVGKNLREQVLERDSHSCVRCGSQDHVQVDHILPQSLGGPHVIENLRTLCRSCNASRPVQGDGLVADLARDGLTVESLRVKFGIDASIPEMTHREERKGKERKVEDASRGDASRGSRLDPQWRPSAEEHRWAVDERPDIDVAVEVEKFRDYWHGKAGAGATKRDWTATWRNWIRNARAGPGGRNGSAAREPQSLPRLKA